MGRLSIALAGVLWLSAMAHADSPIYFADSALKAAVEQTLGISNPTPSDMLALTRLTCYHSDIHSLTGLEYAEHLHELSLSLNSITDLSPLSGLIELQTLILEDNLVSDLSPLSGLTNLDILILESNLISDVSPLLSLTSLSHLNLGENPLNEDAYGIYIPQIAANNPGIYILHERRQHHFVVSAGPGGSVISPGEGDFAYEGRTDIIVEAKADPGFVFVGWTGTYYSDTNPFAISVDEDSDIRAHFISLSPSLHVDDDAPNNPGPGDSSISDPIENGTEEHPFGRIQDAIEVAGKGATVFVQAGTYHETIDLLGKQIQLTGFDPNDPGSSAWPVIDGGGNGPVVTFATGEDPNCVLRGFVLTGGRGRLAGAIYCSQSSPTIANCLIVGNRATDAAGAAVYCADSNAAFVNCTIADNYAGTAGAALSLRNSSATVVNSILWDNEPRQILSDGLNAPAIHYCAVAGGWTGSGNIDADPLFAAPGYWADPAHPEAAVGPQTFGAFWLTGDYHLQSQAGRWDLQKIEWIQDEVTSPCIDAGDPAASADQEHAPNGGIINLGVYGGTAEASCSNPQD